MLIIKELCEQILEEMEDAKKYAKMAIHYKDMEHETADLYYTLSKDEINHGMKLHARVVDTIVKYRKEHGEPPEAMMAVYNYLHDKYMGEAAEIRNLQSLYSG